MTTKLDQADLLALFLAVERHQHDAAPCPIVGPITVRLLNQTRYYAVPVLIPGADGTPELISISVRPIHAPSDYPGVLVGEPITTGSPATHAMSVVQQGIPVMLAEPTNTDQSALDQQAA